MGLSPFLFFSLSAVDGDMDIGSDYIMVLGFFFGGGGSSFTYIRAGVFGSSKYSSGNTKIPSFYYTPPQDIPLFASISLGCPLFW